MILDTNALSALAEGSESILRAAEHVATFSVPVVVVGEYEYGIARSRRREALERWLRQLLDASRVLEIDRRTATAYAVIRERLRKRGRPIPSNDLWIAALAHQHELPVLSRDAHFDEVDVIRRVRW